MAHPFFSFEYWFWAKAGSKYLWLCMNVAGLRSPPWFCVSKPTRGTREKSPWSQLSRFPLCPEQACGPSSPNIPHSPPWPQVSGGGVRSRSRWRVSSWHVSQRRAAGQPAAPPRPGTAPRKGSALRWPATTPAHQLPSAFLVEAKSWNNKETKLFE